MTVVRPNSISGINSITVASGEALSIHAASGDLVSTLTAASGIATYRGIHVGSGTTTADQGVIVGTGASIVSDAVNKLSVYTNNTKNVTIDATKTLLNSPSGADTTVRLQHTGNSGYGDITLDRTVNAFIIDNDPTNAGSNATYLSVKTAGTEKLRILSSGLVGIGTAIPVTEAGWGNSLHVHTAASGAHVRFSDGTSKGTASDGSLVGHYTNDLYLINKESSGSLIINTNGGERARVTSAGLVGIGTQTPAASLHAHGGTNDTPFYVDSANANGAHMRFLQASNVKHYLGCGGGISLGDSEDLAIRAYDTIKFATANSSTEKIRIGASGEIGVAGAGSINFGTSGQFLRSGGTAAGCQWADAGGGIDDSCQWRLTSSLQGNQTPLTGWELVDTYGGGGFGSAMSESSGIFTFPSTGWWNVTFHLHGYSDSSTQNVIAQVMVTTDNSSYSHSSVSQQGIYDFNNSYPSHASTTAQALVDVTSTTNVKVRFDYGAGQGAEYAKGHTTYTYTNAIFTRLGDT